MATVNFPAKLDRTRLALYIKYRGYYGGEIEENPYNSGRISLGSCSLVVAFHWYLHFTRPKRIGT